MFWGPCCYLFSHKPTGLHVKRLLRHGKFAILGQFISWCRNGESGAAELPDETYLYDMVIRYSVRCYLYNSPAAYPWHENTHYCLVISLYSLMRATYLRESALSAKCSVELRKMTKRIKGVEYFKHV
ncbi:replication protein P [Pantoea sp. NPDC088449]|uniref:replication protein P n=1 Tax=Pantoea sp. NPDC088449 TaxID=3364392 RepID=UPI0037FE46AD